MSGMSGAGKSTALKMMEDIGFYCVDNLPVALLPSFGQAVYDNKVELDNVAVVVDIRNGAHLKDLSEQLIKLEEQGIRYEILFMDADIPTLIRRYKETRRTHPLSGDGRIETGIVQERKMVSFIKEKADYVIDTTSLLTRELKGELDKIFMGEEEYGNFIVTILSFGFKYGIPVDSDLVFDVRFLPNPYYDTNLRPLTGDDQTIQEYVMSNGVGEIFLDKLEDMVKFLIPNYLDEGKYRLVIGIGCTGGRHRSVTIANKLYERLGDIPYSVRLEHRDIQKDVRTKQK